MSDNSTAAPMRLGWAEGPDDPRTLRLSTYTTPDMPPPPTATNWLKRVSDWPMLANDRIGDCVPVACAHLIQAWTRYACNTEIRIPEPDVINAYSAISGYNPTTGANDYGCRSLDALNFWRRAGIGGRRVVAYVQLDHTDPVELMTAVHLFGGVYVAAQLPIAADTQFRARQTWSVTRDAAGRRGSWGGHAMHLGAYGSTGLSLTTWGRVQRATWAWWGRYGAEAFAVVSSDWLDRLGGRNPLGFDLDQMLADLRRITA